MNPKRPKYLFIVVCICGIGFFLFRTHHQIGRPDREDAAQAKYKMEKAVAQILRFEFENSRLPKSLDDLVPLYLREDELKSKGGPLYTYEPDKKLIRQRRGYLINGLISYRQTPLEMELPQKSAPRGEALEPPSGAFVFEAELFSEMNYGWEIHPDPEASRGAYLYCKEGFGNGPGQKEYGMYDFYNVRSTKEYTQLRYYVPITEAGEYYVYGLLWTTGIHCSNSIAVTVDYGGPYLGAMQNREPFRWQWSPMKDNPVKLEKGEHFVHVFIHEDGLKLDQILISPQPLDPVHGQPFKPNVVPGKSESAKEPPVNLSFDLKSMVITPEQPPECRLVARRYPGAKGNASIKVVLEDASDEGTDLTLLDEDWNLEELPDLKFMPLIFEKLDLKSLARREYLLKAELQSDESIIAKKTIPLMVPFDWEVSNKFGFFLNEEPGPLDADAEGDTKWKPMDLTSMDVFGVLDFGLQVSNNSLHAPVEQTIYAQTRISVPRTDTYLFKVQADDQMLMWLNGQLVYQHDERRPVTRAGFNVKIELKKGEHRLRIRVNQGDGKWQASVRIRTEEDDVSDVTGLSLEHRRQN